MAKMTAAEMNASARAATIALLTPVFEAETAVQFAENSWAILQMVGDEEIWTAVTIQAKQHKPSKVAPAFDPYEVREVWLNEKRMKEQKAEEKAKAKAKKEADGE